MEKESLGEKRLSGEALSKHVAKMFEERGRKALEIAREVVLEEAEKLRCKEVREALKYFMEEYWRDTTRPALLSIACGSLGGDIEITTHIAVSLMLISGAIDIHDDIIDQSKTKRNKPTVYGKFGKEIALLAGDALLFKGFTFLHEASTKLPSEKADIIFELVKKSYFKLGEGEAFEVSLRKRKQINIKEYMEAVEKKAATFEAYMRISAILANASREEIEALGKYGRILGILVILGDDNADMLDPSELINRIKNELLPLPLIYALAEPYLKRKIVPILQKKKLTQTDAENILDIVYEANIFNKIESQFIKLMSEGQEILNSIKNKNLELLTQILESTYPKNSI
jgi:geranylgeranyl pyrophosphate synthase